ncbi:hypothetical protein E2C01_079953 [Portunus trituberculatus]|uniref:Uncharacterized protein n=1 Tax=Portunus trituberculatus TaxID=210409 RepID=A0A5B7II81_PORTR|nr:hypothetical protein [Portunus trituberculatus]
MVCCVSMEKRKLPVKVCTLLMQGGWSESSWSSPCTLMIMYQMNAKQSQL